MADSLPAALYTPADVLAGVMAAGDRPECRHERALLPFANVRCDECDTVAVLDAVVPGLLARHLEELAAAHDATAARTDHRIAPGSKVTARVFARWLRRHAATLTPKAPAVHAVHADRDGSEARR